VSKSKWSVLGLAVVLAVFVFRDARAGNIPSPAAPACQVYSIELPMGAAFNWVVPPAPADPTPIESLVVDDITYSVFLDPCNCASRCVVFDRNFTGVLANTGWTQIADGVADPTGGPNYEWWWLDLPPAGLNAADQCVIRWAEARGTNFRAVMQDIDGEGNPIVNGVFDAISHSLYGQVMGRWFDNWDMTPPMTETLTTSIAITQTSESRHYQTPYVLTGSAIMFATVGGTGISTYINAVAYVKGRVFFSNSPLRNTSFNVWTVP